ncbi:hypothetical protein [Sulfitobacter sp. R18_1]|uniref:hypothetical protein n=1 Tax=Sulfitobacter sp. R18_1 TaxID=2821104 RepID=UPI001ADBC3E3|nr:hypothetical protein [Sulfitobacter sp. R18_1]MBO9428800.1 hypothetical protein [Sulfitobacter sp. R18_1]
MIFSIQVLVGLAVLIAVIWWSNSRTQKAQETVQKLPDLRDYLRVNDHGLLASIRTIEAHIADWRARENDPTYRAQGADGIKMLAKTLEARQAAVKDPEELEVMDLKFNDELTRMRAWLQDRLAVLPLLDVPEGTAN